MKMCDNVLQLSGKGRRVGNPTPLDFNVCLYHFGCPDGIGGAFPFWKISREYRSPMIFRGVKHNEPYPLRLVK